MNRSADLLGTFRLLAHGGKTQAVVSGYRPTHRLYDNYFTSGEHRYAPGSVEVGGSADVEVWLITPQVYPGSLWVGREVDVYEGSKHVGVLHVTAIKNDVLLGSAEAYRPMWEEPPGLSREGA